MTARCRFCSSSAGELEPAHVLTAALPGSALARRRTAPVYEHAACLEAYTAAHAAGELVRTALYAAGSEAARQGRLADALALADAAVDVLDSHYLEAVR